MTIILHDVNGLQIGQRSEDGYINLTGIAKASNKKLNDYLRLNSTKALVNELSMNTGISIPDLVSTKKGKPVDLQGTWGHPQVAISCGHWSSPQLAILVTRWVIDLDVSIKLAIRIP
ncbi:hypothetical protein DSM106972_038940 [Dulcicalothrix desertica PCC 7102]|uniref:KilA-N domain-containing protein n=1 Tax=Dulcicalothrix desertica PCC 7102 TaxID=232991 RepID=A0A433VG58_9CYAN|nr:KilA-N domain-containing protein [Dulcicalothrix desertica]RUT05073.1 hypothetical protein DSM106972_038940 [Dulcicalothrix desertica PCC 7102]TWH62614.1 ParB family chromosome partitioning protein [Dulcicalothrix desertica PCC 7102]